MTVSAEGAQRPEHEGVVIAAMRRVVISDRRRSDAALLLAQGAQRGGRELVLGPSSPGLQRVPTSPVERLRGCEVACVHGSRKTNRIIPISASDRLIVCDCGWASELGPHYRVRPDGDLAREA
jgi:hypothetical protein